MGGILSQTHNQPAIHEVGAGCDDNDGCPVFSRFYSINLGAGHNGSTRSKSGSESVEGLNSPWGQWGEICSHFGWTYDYLLRGIAWINVQLMLADGAKMKSIDKDKSESNQSQPAKKMTGKDLRDYFNNRRAQTLKR